MKATTTMKKNKKAMLAVLGILTAMTIALLCVALASCSEAAVAGSVGSQEAKSDMSEGMTEKLKGSIETCEVVSEDTATPGSEQNEGTDDAPSSETVPASRDAANGGSMPGGQGTSAASSISKSDSKPSAPASAARKKWMEDTQQVWVEDRAAWTEQVPVYSSKEVSICNVCGQDITGNTSAHAKAHMLAGEGSGHHSEVKKTVTGYNTVNHPAEGHYETKVVGGHWE